MPGVGRATSPRVVISDTEAQAIWGRAAELQEATSSQPMPALPPSAGTAAGSSHVGLFAHRRSRIGARSRHRHEGVDHALAEYGLAPGRRDFARAGHDRGSLRGEEPSRRRSAPASSTRWSSTARCSERDFDLLGDVIRQRMAGDAGTLTAVGRSLSWSSNERRAAAQCPVVARRGKTRFDARKTSRVSPARSSADDGRRRRRLGAAWCSAVIMGSTHHPLAALADLARHRRDVLRPRPHHLRRQGPRSPRRSSARWSKRSRTKSASRSRADRRSLTGLG